MSCRARVWLRWRMRWWSFEGGSFAGERRIRSTLNFPLDGLSDELGPVFVRFQDLSDSGERPIR